MYNRYENASNSTVRGCKFNKAQCYNPFQKGWCFMNQEKTGKFIAKKRKEKSLTQQELADILGISNKTISKWECGNGLPEVSLMMPLCEVLGISVNELLSGEELDNTYVEKAEENFIELIKEKENTKLSNQKLALWQIVSVFITIVLWLILFADSNVYQLGQRPTPITLCYLAIGLVSIYATVSICGYGLLKRNTTMIFTALSFASLVCLLVCLGYKHFG